MKKNGFRDGFLADMLRDLKDQYDNEDSSKGKGKGKRDQKREEISSKNEKPDTLPVQQLTSQKKSQTALPGFDFHSGDMILDTYRVESEPSMGGMGAVWRVHHIGWDVDQALDEPGPAP